MASASAGAPPPVSLRHGIRCVPAIDVSVEDVLMAVGEEIGYENISSASRMNKAVVVFVKDESQVNRLLSNGIVVSGEFVIVSPLVAPTTKVTVSNVPPFVTNDEIERGLSRYGKFASAIRVLPLGCKNEALKHVMSFRRQVFMFLNEPDLDVSFRVFHEKKSYMIYANAGSLKCFECGDVGHKKLSCPHKAGTSGEYARPSTSAVAVNSPEEALPSVVEERDAQSVEQSDSENGQNEKDVTELEMSENGVINDNVNEPVYDVVADVNDDSKREENCDLDMKDDDTLSEISDVGSQLAGEVYTLQEINDFLDKTFGKTVEVKDFFPDLEKFIASVLLCQRTASYEILDKKKRFRLKKMVTKLRKDKLVLTRNQNE